MLKRTVFCIALAALLALGTSAFAGQLETISAAGLMEAVHAEKERAVVVNFWATWCAPCIRELPSLARLRAEFNEDELLILAVSLDFDPDQAARFIQREQLPFPVYFAEPALMDELDIGAIPKTWFFAPGGVLVANHDGPASFAKLLETVNTARKSAPAGRQ